MTVERAWRRDRDDDVIISPGRIAAAQIQGHLSRVESRTASSGKCSRHPMARRGRPDAAGSEGPQLHLLFRLVIRFGKLTMTGADLQLIDVDERDPFDFYPSNYNEQLVAGYSKNTPAKGLKTYMPDFADLRPGLDLRPPAR